MSKEALTEITWKWLKENHIFVPSGQPIIFSEPLTKKEFIANCYNIYIHRIICTFLSHEQLEELENKKNEGLFGSSSKLAEYIWEVVYKSKKSLVDKIVESAKM
jgi:hypothetical protein